jgi:hypothetical protein
MWSQMDKLFWQVQTWSFERTARCSELRLSWSNVLAAHCIIPCSQHTVIKRSHFLQARGLNYKESIFMLKVLSSEHLSALLPSTARWVCLGKVPKNVWSLREDIIMFSEIKCWAQCLHTWKTKTGIVIYLLLLIDNLEHWNNFNVIIQGKESLNYESHTVVKAFQTKLLLSSKQIKKTNSHISALRKASTSIPA